MTGREPSPPTTTLITQVEGVAGSLSADHLASALAEEMAQRWQQGQAPVAEDYLRQHPQLGEHPSAALRLIYEEVCLRQEQGQADAPALILERFPQWQAELEGILNCHELIHAPDQAEPFRPGGMLGEYRLLAELGRGAQGAVFLAAQTTLASRPVVLKLTPLGGREHLSLARLQHTHIVPLYAAHDDFARQFRLLSMPYYGGVTLARLFTTLEKVPLAQRTGRMLVDALDECQRQSPILLQASGPARRFFAQASYEHTICWIVACLADALHYAHERDLVHLDVKPANVLITVDGLPMLLDFHLARSPITPDDPHPGWIGGTPAYMAPEQRQALAALRQGKPIREAVDGRADVFALGLLMRDAFGGSLSPPLQEVIIRCLSESPRQRYPTARALAEDLKRHLADLPLQGVRNRSCREAWHKWRRRRPYALALVGLGLAVFATLLVVIADIRRRYAEPQQALASAHALLVQGEYPQALEILEEARVDAHALPFTDELVAELDTSLARVRQAIAQNEQRRFVEQLQQVVKDLLFAGASEHLTDAQAQSLVNSCSNIWARMEETPPDAIHDDLRAVAILWTDLLVRSAAPAQKRDAHRTALRVLDTAATRLGENPLLRWERARHAQALGVASNEPPPEWHPRSGWEHLLRGRARYQEGDLGGAREAFLAAIAADPSRFWPHFYLGICAHRLGRFEEADHAFSICIALAPESALCYHNRALARVALDRNDVALADYSRALERDSTLAATYLNRGLLQFKILRYIDSIADLQSALRYGIDPVVGHFNLALVYDAAGNRPSARQALATVLELNPSHPEGQELWDQWNH